MLKSPILSVAIGIALGFLSGLGVGGGSLLILWLTLILQMEHQYARALNLLFFIITAAVVCIFRWRKGMLKWDIILPAAFMGCITAATFAAIGKILEGDLVRKLLGILFLATGLREVFYRPQKDK